jgi:hypothetical protein
MPIGETAAQPLNVGISPLPVVTPPAPVITPDAVGQLVDSFRKGIITGNDISDHMGLAATARKRAEIQQYNEMASPDAVAQRQAARQAATAQSNLTTAQAGAEQGLVAPMADKSLGDIVQANSTRLTKDSVNAWLMWNMPVYKRDGEGNLTKEYDYDAMSRGGIQYLKAQNNLAYSQKMLSGQWTEVQDQKTGQKRKVFINANGEDVTPVPGNKLFDYYNDMRRDAWETFHTPAKEPEQHPAGKHPNIESMVSPGNIPDAPPAPMIVPQPAPAAPVVSPATATPSGPPPVDINQYSPMQGLPIGPQNTVWDEGKTSDELQKNPIYQNWAQTRTQVGNFVSAANSINSVPWDQQLKQNMNPQDIALAESLIKMYDPQGVIREFKWDKFADNQPLLSKLRDAQQMILRTGEFTRDVRQDLIKLGQETIRAREDGVKPTLQQAVQRASSNPTNDLRNILDPHDTELLKGSSFADRIIPPVGRQAPAAGSASAASPQSGVVRLTTGRYAGWNYNPATGTVSPP